MLSVSVSEETQEILTYYNWHLNHMNWLQEGMIFSCEGLVHVLLIVMIVVNNLVQQNCCAAIQKAFCVKFLQLLVSVLINILKDSVKCFLSI